MLLLMVIYRKTFLNVSKRIRLDLNKSSAKKKINIWKFFEKMFFEAAAIRARFSNSLTAWGIRACRMRSRQTDSTNRKLCLFLQLERNNIKNYGVERKKGKPELIQITEAYKKIYSEPPSWANSICFTTSSLVTVGRALWTARMKSL